jgi:hypothetical protein
MTGFFKRIAFIPLVAFCLPSEAQNHEQEIHRALIQRDQQAAEFAASARGDAAARARLEVLHEQQRRELPLAPEFLPYQRQRMAEERALILPPPRIKERSGTDPDLEKALALPGGAKAGVDPVLPQGLPY